ncbi:MAG TPA: hypothetical protein DCZ91_18000 [Lachnospiraceae bacterium]|nr:hypothetical protein [Lachnospiraceae bacterium]
MGKRILSFIIYFVLLASLLSLSACGRQEHQRGIDGYIYEAELLSGTVTTSRSWNFKVGGEWMYYVEDYMLYRIPLKDGSLAAKAGEKVFDSGKTVDYTVDETGALYCFKPVMDWQEGRVELKGGVLTKHRADGSEDYSFSLDGREDSYPFLYEIPGFLASGSGGRVFLRSGNEIIVIDRDGRMLCEIDISAIRPVSQEDVVERLLEGEDGRVYYLSEVAERRTVYELVDEDGVYRPRAMQMKGLEGKDLSLGYYHGSCQGLLYSGADGILYRYSAKEGIWKALLRWGDSNLWQDALEVVRDSEGRLFALFSSHGSDVAARELYLLERKSLEEIPEKEELVLACYDMYTNDLENAVIAYNRSNDSCHITLQMYEGEDGLARLDAGLASSNPPDMLNLWGLDVKKYSEKRALEDLSIYLEKSEKLGRENFLEGVLEGYTVEDRLVGIPSEFMCFTMFGNAAEVGEKAGWTLEDIMLLTERYPGRKLNGYSFSRNLEDICGSYVMEQFVDWENGACRFDSEEFRSLVQWLAEHSGSGTGYYDYEEVEAPLTVQERVFTLLEYLHYVSRSDGEMTMMGFPSADGRPLHRGGTVNAVGIISKSRHKEEAWQFIEYFLCQDEGQEWESALYMPTRRDLLEAILEDATVPEYWTDHGEVRKDGKGEPEQRWKWKGSYRSLKGEIVDYEYYDCADQEEIEGFLDMIGHTDFSLDDYLQSEVTGIIAEEMGSYFTGDKALEEVTKVIQNRVSTLIQE